MVKITAKAPANIAFIKYWGKRNERLRIPANSSISMNLSEAYTITSVEYQKKLTSDKFILDGVVAGLEETKRVSRYLDLIRKTMKVKEYAGVVSKNSFPKGAGIASSASGFAALTLAATKAAGQNLSEKQLSILARMGSGSACRSIPDGFVEWKTGRTGQDSSAHSLYPPAYWDICDVIAIVGENSKKVSSTEGHALAESSPFYKTRIAGMKNKIKEIKSALKKRDFTKFGEILEAEAINMHAVMMTSAPALFYWLPATLEIILAVQNWRNEGLECYFTVDAGPNVHIICRRRDVVKVKKHLDKIRGIKKLLVNKPAAGTYLV